MAKKVAVVIREDPRKTHRPVEALRIALGLVAGTHETTVVLLNDAVRLLSEDLDDVIDVDILEKYLPSIEHLEIHFIIQHDTDKSLVQSQFAATYETPDAIRKFLESVDRTLVF